MNYVQEVAKIGENFLLAKSKTNLCMRMCNFYRFNQSKDPGTFELGSGRVSHISPISLGFGFAP